MKTKMLFFILLVAAVAVTTVFLVAADNNKPFLPGITVPDEHPNGCVDCHKVSGGNDHRLNVELADVDGHPKIDAIVKNVPQDCLMCQGACLNCHALNPGSGKMSVKNGPKNW
jgi:hypothetical protein